jgi:hypothetical protein
MYMRLRVMPRVSAALLALALAVAPARAAPPAAPGDPLRPVAYALVVGTNRGGPGQGDLRYAERDARRVAELLTDLGGYHASRVELIEQPSRAGLVEALAAAGRKLAQHAARGDKSLFLFYYSGHARSTGLNLGHEILPLSELRERLQALPSTVVLAVLDACQSGAFSRVKGAEPAADFSFNSVTQLSTAGIAVMASSGASELSQESDRLQSSFFTHHLLAALRGVADLDRDGHVTLAEAYRYAYHRTLTDTASTTVGSQHATLETGLRGKGELVLSYPAEAGAQLDLPLPVQGDLLIERRPSGSVIAELHKAAGESLRLALPPGDYRAVWRREAADARGEVRVCALQLRDGQVTIFAPSACERAPEMEVAALKGEGDDDSNGASARRRPPWALELGGGLMSAQGYRARSGQRGFQQVGSYGELTALSLAGVRRLGSNLELVVDLRQLDHQTYLRLFDTPERDRFSFRVFGLGTQLRAVARLWGGRVNLYLQGGVGLTLGRRTMETFVDADGRAGPDTRVERGWFPGFFGSIANGLSVPVFRDLSGFFQLRYSEVKDLFGLDRSVEMRGHVTDALLGLRLGLGRSAP